MSDNNLLEYIEIKDFKCFKDFKAEGFKRVNLIGGKNNVGKTAFMEACYLGLNAQSNNKKQFFHSLLVVSLNRNPLKEFQIIEDSNNFDFKFNNSIIKINDKICTIEEANLIDNNLYNDLDKNYKNGIKEITQFYRGNKNQSLHLDIKNNSFLSQTALREDYIINSIDEIKLLRRIADLNKLLKNYFDIEEIDIIKDKIMLLNKDEIFVELFEFGDGIKQFIIIFLSLYLNKDKVIFIDEIDNGIHYTLLDKLWEIILTISKEQNVQVFATTHSKECIESYARVSKKLEDKDISFIELGRDKENKLSSIVYPYDWFLDEISQNHEVRGW